MTLRRPLLLAILAIPMQFHAAASVEFDDVASLPGSGWLVVPTGESKPRSQGLSPAARVAFEAALAAAEFKAMKGKTRTLLNVAGNDRVMRAGTGERARWTL